MIRIHEFKIKALEKTETLPAKIEARLHLPSGGVKSFSIAKESIDARQKPDVYKVYSLDIETEKSDEEMLRLCKKAGLKAELTPENKDFAVPKAKGLEHRPVIAGFGPCWPSAPTTWSI